MPYALQKGRLMDERSFEPGFAVQLALKDLDLADESAGLSPLFQVVRIASVAPWRPGTVVTTWQPSTCYEERTRSAAHDDRRFDAVIRDRTWALEPLERAARWDLGAPAETCPTGL